MDSNKKQRIDYLISRCLTQTESLEERNELDSYLGDPVYADILEDAILESFSLDKMLVDINLEKRDDIFQAIISADEANPIASQRRNYYWIGLSLLIISLFAAVSYILIYNFHSEFQGPVAQRVERNLETPSKKQYQSHPKERKLKNETLLQLADGSKISLDNLKKGQDISFNGLLLRSEPDGTLLLRYPDKVSKDIKIGQKNYSIATPVGRTFKIVLADGTRVHLNTNSRLTISSAFSEKERRVTLEGEAYFEVAKDKERQFVVTSGLGINKQEVRVFGTEFNIMAYAEDENIETTLVEGSVKIVGLSSQSERYLKPNEMAVLNKGGVTISTTDIPGRIAWKNNMFYFTDDNIEKVMKEIGRWYDVKIVYGGTIPEVRIWGQISRGKKLEQLLEILAKAHGFKFEIRGKEVEIMP